MCEVFKVFVVPIILTFIFLILDKSCKTLCNRIFYDFYDLTGFFVISAPVAAPLAVATPAPTAPPPQPTPVLPQNPIQLPTAPTTMLSPPKAVTAVSQAPAPTIIRMAAPNMAATGGQILRTIGGQNVVRVRAPAPTLAAGQQIKVVGSSGQIIKSTTVSAAQAQAAQGRK